MNPDISTNNEDTSSFSHPEEAIVQTKREQIVATQKNGLTILSIGAVLLLSSCLMSFIVSYSHPTFHYVLYGVTTIGICVAFYGLIKVFG